MTIETTATSTLNTWFKSSYSNALGSCLETRFTTGSTAVRDSKDRKGDSPLIKFSPEAWSAFLHRLKA
jgi:uncharacterized protein DUF397